MVIPKFTRNPKTSQFQIPLLGGVLLSHSLAGAMSTQLDLVPATTKASVLQKP